MREVPAAEVARLPRQYTRTLTVPSSTLHTDSGTPCAGYEGARVHNGFMASLNSSTLYTQLKFHLEDLMEQQPVSKVYFLGHSLGAAMAAIAAPLMKAELGLRDVHLWTFGCPRVGNLVRAHSFSCVLAFVRACIDQACGIFVQAVLACL